MQTGGTAMSEAELFKRLERLEMDNRRLKRIALVALVLVAATVGLGATYSKSEVPQKVVAHEFEVVDGSGRVRVRLGSEDYGDSPFVTLLGQGQNSLVLSVGGVSSTNRSTRVGPWIAFRDSHGAPALSMGTQGERPMMNFTDQQGYSMNLGCTGTIDNRTGQTRQTSAASIVMSANDKTHHVIWQAPQ
jgi:hypothetical protein